MAGRYYAASEIAKLLTQVSVERSRGLTLTQATRVVGVPYVTYHRWVKRFGGLDGPQVQTVRDLARENARLRRALEELDEPAPVTVVRIPGARAASPPERGGSQHTSRDMPLTPHVLARRTHH